MPSLQKIEGIGKKFAEGLAKVGIKTTDRLLKEGATRKGRSQLAKATKLSEKLILKWTNRADLFRVKGIGEEYSDLLEVAGVDTVVELSKRKPANLHESLVATNAKKKLVRRVPPLKSVENWVAQAKKLPRVMKY